MPLGGCSLEEYLKQKSKLPLPPVGSANDRGTIIESYRDDTPFASYLVLYFINDCPIHVVYSIDESTNIIYIITAYNPDPSIWENNFSVRE
jgi:hypothetical protein